MSSGQTYTRERATDTSADIYLQRQKYFLKLTAAQFLSSRRSVATLSGGARSRVISTLARGIHVPEITVLFLCPDNSLPGPLAEAYLSHKAGSFLRAFPRGQILPAS
jgi:hypothetical protein